MKNHYTLIEFMENIYFYIMTKFTMKQARFIRRPIYIRGKKSLVGCEGLTTGRFCRFDLEGTKSTLFIGKNCEMGELTHIVAHEKVEIGDNVLIASKCFISDTNHGTYKGVKQDNPKIAPNKRDLSTKPVKIGNNVWIGENAVILAGSIIGDGCVIGANSVINTAIPENSMVAGIPGLIIKKWNEKTEKWEKVKGFK